MTTLHLRKSIGRSPCRGALLLIPLAIAATFAEAAVAAPSPGVVAGGFCTYRTGYLSTSTRGPNGHYSSDNFKRAVVHGNIIGSFVCADFSIGRLRTLTMNDVAKRYKELVAYSHFDPDWRPGQA